MEEHKISFGEDVFSPRSEGRVWNDPDNYQAKQLRGGRRLIDPGEAVVVLEEIVNRGIALGVGVKGEAEDLVNLHSQLRFVLHGTRPDPPIDSGSPEWVTPAALFIFNEARLNVDTVLNVRKVTWPTFVRRRMKLGAIQISRDTF